MSVSYVVRLTPVAEGVKFSVSSFTASPVGCLQMRPMGCTCCLYGSLNGLKSISHCYYNICTVKPSLVLKNFKKNANARK